MSSRCDECKYQDDAEYHACHICTMEKDMFCPKKTLTNADRIRAMADEEMADFLAFEQGQIVKKLASKFGFLEHRSLYPTPIEWLEWLKQEASDDEC